MLALDHSFPRDSPVCDYWLARCEGFTVRSGHRTLGVVEAVLAHTDAARTETIVLRKRHRRRALAPADVLAVVPARKILLTRRREHAGPLVRRTAVGLWALARGTAALLRREVPRLTRLALAEIHDRNARHGAEPSVGRAHRKPNEYAFVQQPLGRGRNVGPTRTR